MQDTEAMLGTLGNRQTVSELKGDLMYLDAFVKVIEDVGY